jgi:hypothetical protein
MIHDQCEWVTIKISCWNEKIVPAIARHSPSYKLYLAFILLLDELTYATTNF